MPETSQATHLIARKPPGSYGPPLLGRLLGTLEFFLFGWESYFTRRQRRHQSTVFRVNLFQPTVAVLDREGIGPLFDAPDLQQDYGFSWAKPPRALVGKVTPSIFLSGDAHDRHKSTYIDFLARRACDLERVFDEVLNGFMARWARERTFNWADEIERFSLEFLFEWLLGVRPEIGATRDLYNNIFFHFAPRLEAILPWSNYSRAIRYYPDLVDLVRRSPGFAEFRGVARDNGLSDDDALVHQVTFLLGMNSYLGTQSLLKSLVGELSRQPPLRSLICGSIAGSVQLSQIALDRTLDSVLRETLRLHPPVSFIFGRATQARTLTSRSGDFEIAKGELVMGVLTLAQRDPRVFSQPDEFRPGRYEEPGVSRHLIWARGEQDGPLSASNRTCPGKDVAVLIGKLWTTRLVHGATWTLADTPAWDHKRFGLNAAAPIGPLHVTSFARSL